MTDNNRPRLIEEHVESAVEELCQHYKKGGGNRNVVFERLFKREKNTRLRNQYLDEDPERFVERTLVWPVLTSLGFEYKKEVKIANRGRTDFVISNTTHGIIGEVKPLGAIHESIGQATRYFETSEYDYAIVTDGLYWELIKNDETSIASIESLCHGELRGIVAEYALGNNIVDEEIIELSSKISPTTADQFYSSLGIENVNSLI